MADEAKLRYVVESEVARPSLVLIALRSLVLSWIVWRMPTLGKTVEVLVSD